MSKFTGFYLRTGYPGDCISGVSNVTSNWLGLPYPPGRHLRCDPYRESLGSLRAYYYNPHIITISQPYCSLCMPKARGACYESLVNTGTTGSLRGKKRGHPFRESKSRYQYHERLEPPHPTQSLLLLLFSTATTV